MKQKAFTLTEILIVIAIIVVLIALAVPAFSLITGGKSIEGATNQLSAALGRARAEAIGSQQPTGIMFFIEPRSQRAMIAIVKKTDAPLTVGLTAQIGDPLPDAWLDLADADFIPLPIGVLAQTICDGNGADRYLGFNVAGITPTGGANNSTVPFGGVILFDSYGRLANLRYAFRCVDNANVQTRLGGLLKPSTDMIPGNKNFILRSQLGLVMIERDLFTATQGANDTDSIVDGSSYPASEAAEETWLDNNSTPILINRYTGTLVKGE